MYSTPFTFTLPYFNSIKVRLEPYNAAFPALTDIKFQFHKGTIRTIADHVPKKVSRNFNSIKVRLELCIAAIIETCFSRFQFHKGTIRTCVFSVNICPSTNFNSIKVRLELEFLYESKSEYEISIP